MNEELWPQQRQPRFPDSADSPQLLRAWRFSRERITAICDALCDHCLPPEIATVAVSGSLNRMEAHDASDLDLLIVVDDRFCDFTSSRTREIEKDVWSRLEVTDVRAPRPGGIFSQCARWSQLVDETSRGVVDESLNTFGQRMQLLVDAQPLVQHEKFVDLQTQILTWYSETRVAAQFDETGAFHWMWQDVQRYWRSLRSRSCWLYRPRSSKRLSGSWDKEVSTQLEFPAAGINADDTLKSLEVNLKLRSSRLVIVAAFLLAIANAHRHDRCAESQREHLLNSLRLTPLERLTLAATDESHVRKLIGTYEIVWHHVASLHVGENRNAVIPESVKTALNGLLTEVCDCVSATAAAENRAFSSNWLF